MILILDTSGDHEVVRILSEQKECAAYLLSDQPDKSGARLGLADWVMEEVIMRTEHPSLNRRGTRHELSNSGDADEVAKARMLD